MESNIIMFNIKNALEFGDFKEANIKIGEGQEEFRTIPAYLCPNNAAGLVIFCLKLNLWQCIKLLFTRRIWLGRLTYRQNFQPMFMELTKPAELDLMEKNND